MKIGKMECGAPTRQLNFRQSNLNTITETIGKNLNIAYGRIAQEANPTLKEGFNLALKPEHSIIKNVAKTLRIFITLPSTNGNELCGCVENLNFTDPKTFSIKFKEGITPLRVKRLLTVAIGRGAQAIGFSG